MKLGTKAIHGRHPELRRSPGDPVTFPVYQTSTFRLGDADYELFTTGNTRIGNLYTRLGNPTNRFIADKFAYLHGAERGEFFASGMGALSAALLAFLKAGDSVLTSVSIYGGTMSLLNREFRRLAIEPIYVDAEFVGVVKAAIKPTTRIFLFETISNPLLKVPNVPELAAIAAERGVLLVVDNTFASPVNFRPLEHGADIVVESCTKYVAGHSDVIGGLAAGSDVLMERVWRTGTSLGASPDPLAAFLVDRGMKTLPLRVERHNENAMAVAEFLSAHGAVEKVFYPGLPSHPDNYVAKSMLGGFGGVVSFVLKGGNEAGITFMRALKIPIEATSLGGVESLVEMPFNTSHAPLTEAERAAAGIVPGLVRLSVGIEEFEDLMEDVSQALDTVL
ncbi:MAG: aminotransferase class I/II-fold pyridoxal phosphate-dependent enzyme [Deltaproteobacteria bacterium]|nr:aminotransferase class I/II-fold pyridoxal phosphate-dependent enzyme [Deltaproteobacteria bacterium]